MPLEIPIGAKADEASWKSVADKVDKVFTELGGKIGTDLSSSLAEGFASSESSVRSSANKLASQYDKVADATGKVKTIQEQYNAALESGNTVRIVRETERLEAARRKESQAIRQTINDLRDYEEQAQKAQSAFGTGFSSGFSRSHIGGYFSGLKAEAESSGSMAGVLAGRAMGAGITAGVAAATAGVAAVIGGVGYTLTKGFQRLEGIDQAKFKLTALGHSGSEVAAIMGNAEASVKGTAFALNDAVGAAASAVAAGVNPGSDLKDYLTTIGDAAAVAGTNFDEMASIFNKVTTSNKAYTQELRQLADRGIPIFTWLQKAYKVSGEELDKMVEDGAVNAATFRGVVAANIGGAAKEMGQSFSGAMDNLGAAISRLGAAALTQPFDSAADVIGGLTNKLDEMTAWMSSHQSEVIDFWSAIGQVAVGTAEAVAVATGGILKSVAWVVNAIGDTLGTIGKIPGVGKMLFHDNGIDPNSFFGWADGLNRAVDDMVGAKNRLGSFGNSIATWGEDAKAAIPLMQALGGTAADVSGNDVTIGAAGVKDVASPGGIRDQLKMIGIGLQDLPDGRLKLVAETEEATRTIEAWKKKQGEGGLPLGRAPGDFTPTIDGSGKKGKEAPPQFDRSLWSLDALPVAGVGPGMPMSAPMQIAGGPGPMSLADVIAGMPGLGLGGGRTARGFYQVDPQKVFDAETSLLNARNRVEESRIRLLELEHKENVSQSALISAKNNVLEAERALQSAQMKAVEAQQGTLKKQTDALTELGAAIDQDFGISKGLPGIAENITKFLANLAFAPALGALQAVVYAGGAGAGAAVGGAAAGIAGYGSPMAYGGTGFGGNVAAMMALAQSASGKTKYGPASDLVNGLADCSGSISDLVEMLQTGQTTPGRLFTTTDFATDEGAARVGFRPGYMPGALNVGVNPYPGQSGHMAATLPNGVHFEGGGGTGGGAQYGGSAAGADDPQFEKRYHMPIGPPTLGASSFPSGALSNVPSAPAAIGGGMASLPAPAVIGGDGASLPSLGPGIVDMSSTWNNVESPANPGGPGLTAPTLYPSGGQGLAPSVPSALTGVPMPAPVGIAGAGGDTRSTGMAPVGLAPSTGAGGEGFQGVSGLPLDAMMTAASALDVLAPGASIAAQKGIQLINRAIGYGGQLAGIGVSGLMNTFLPRESVLGDMGNSWVGRIASGFAGARPSSKNMAGQSTLPNPDDARKQQPGAQQAQPGGNTINNNVTLNNNGATEDAQGKDLTHHLTQTYTRPGPR